MGHHNDYRNFASFHALGFLALMASDPAEPEMGGVSIDLWS